MGTGINRVVRVRRSETPPVGAHSPKQSFRQSVNPLSCSPTPSLGVTAESPPRVVEVTDIRSSESTSHRFAGVARRHTVAAFLAITFVASWAYGEAFLRYVDPVVTYPLSQIASLPFAWGPLVAAAVVVYVASDVRAWFDRMLSPRVPLRWYAVAFFLPVVVQDAPELLLLAQGEPVVAAGVAPVQYLLVFAFTFVLGGALEEFGWRGFLQERLQSRHGATTAAVAVGVVWAVWHYPLYAAGYTLDGHFAVFTAYLVGLAVAMAWVYNSTAGVLPVMVLHAAHNMPSFLAPGDGASSVVLDHSLPLLAGVWLAVAAVLTAYYGATTLSADRQVPGPRSEHPRTD